MEREQRWRQPRQCNLLLCRRAAGDQIVSHEQIMKACLPKFLIIASKAGTDWGRARSAL